MLDTAQRGVMIVGPDGKLLLHNRTLRELLGYGNRELRGITLGQLAPAGALEHVTTAITERTWSEGAPTRREMQLVRRDGHVLDVDASLSALREADESVGVLLEVRDLTDSRRASETIHRMAEYDALTGLPSRARLERHLQQALSEAERSGRSVAVLMMDLDRFMRINDAVGHSTGDRVLRAVGRRLLARLSPSHTLARFGGDEFLVLLPDVERRDEVDSVARALVASIAAPFDREGRELHLVGSVGVSRYPEHGDDAHALTRHAGAAVHRAKVLGGGRHVLYERAGEAASQDLQDRLSLDADLRHALERGEFVLRFQPIVEIASGEMVAAEALIRWRHPSRGTMPPSEFIPALEETGLIVPVGEWVLRAACRQARAWQAAGLAPLRIAVNVSPLQFLQSDLASTVRRVLEETGLDPTLLELELTETADIEDIDTASQALKTVRAMGVRTAVDDFGTGYSSLGRLRQFPVDTLKIDRSFVSGAGEAFDSLEDLAIVRGIVALGHAMGLSVVAEGVETESQLAVLRQMGCDLAQGFLYSPAVEANEVARLLAEGTGGRMAT